MTTRRACLAAPALLLISTVLAPTMAAHGDEPILAPDARPQQLLAEGAGEGPAWDPQLGLLFSGLGHTMHYDRGQLKIFRESAGSNGLLFDRQGRLLTCEASHRRVTRRESDGSITNLAEQYGGLRFNQPNDLTVDSLGRIYFSDPRYGDRSSIEMVDANGQQVEGVYRIDPDGTVTRVITHQVDRPNGLLVTPDDRYLYVADNNNNTAGGARKLWRFHLRPDGTIDDTSRCLIYDWRDSRGPDGMVLDAKGRLYVAGGRNQPTEFETNSKPGGVYVFSATGKLLTVIRIAHDEVTNCTFGGRDLRTLFITAGGTLWSVRTQVPGKLPWG